MSQSKQINYKQSEVLQNDLPGILKKDFKISERVTMGAVESLRIKSESIPDDAGVSKEYSKESKDIEGLKNGDDAYNPGGSHVRLTKKEEYDIVISMTYSSTKRDESEFAVQGWKK
jgi:hypothetical protein